MIILHFVFSFLPENVLGSFEYVEGDDDLDRGSGKIREQTKGRKRGRRGRKRGRREKKGKKRGKEKRKTFVIETVTRIFFFFQGVFGGRGKICQRSNKLE